MKLLVTHPDPEGAKAVDGMEVVLKAGNKVMVETTPGKGITISVKPDGTLRIEVDVEPDDAPCLSVVPD